MLRRASRGFSLVELMVSLGIFSMVATMATGAYLIIIGANRHAQAIATGINSVSYALENMTRNIRTGHDYACEQSSEAETFSFTDTDNTQVTYSTLNGQILMTKESVTSAVTDPSVGVDTLYFNCAGGLPGDGVQSSVVMTVLGHVTSGPARDTTFAVQTMAVMRTPDL